MNQHILNLLNDAEDALRRNLHRHDLDSTARAHMERAVSHVREAFIATNEIGKARTVAKLVHDCEAFERLLVKIREQQAPGTITVKLKV